MGLDLWARFRYHGDNDLGTGDRTGMIIIRSAVPADGSRLAQIYRYYVENTAVSFEYVAPDAAEFRSRIERTLANYPYLVLEEDGVILGYAYAGPFKARAAYARSAELSIYLDSAARGRGLGARLYEALEAEMAARGFLNLYACIADPVTEDEYLTRGSERFHQRMGFARAGSFRRCAFKFGRWYNMIWMEKLIGEHKEECPWQ